MLLLHRMLELVFAAKLGFQQIQQARRVFADTLKALDPLSRAVPRIHEMVDGNAPGRKPGAIWFFGAKIIQIALSPSAIPM